MQRVSLIKIRVLGMCCRGAKLDFAAGTILIWGYSVQFDDTKECRTLGPVFTPHPLFPSLVMERGLAMYKVLILIVF